MKPLGRMAEEYLALRRSLGFKLIDAEYVLRWFIDFMRREHKAHITTESVLRWIHSSNISPATKNSRFTTIRKFAQYAHALDEHHEVPANRLVTYRTRRPAPHIYSEGEVLRLLQACLTLASVNGLCRHTYYTVLGLLAVTGMRISEATSLSRDDVDLATGIITIRQAKFNKTRSIPVHASVVRVLRTYLHRRDEIFGHNNRSVFFLSDLGNGFTSGVLRCEFLRISHRIGLRKPNQRHGPRIHDLRHTFAVRTVMRWYREGADVEQQLPLLSTYLGHSKPSDTYWYLSSVPELVALAAQRLEGHQGGHR